MAAVEILEIEASDKQVEEIRKLIEEIASDGPRTEIAALRVKKIMKSMASETYDIAKGIVTDIASEMAKKTLGF